MTALASPDEPEDPDWRFDPENPPDRFTLPMLRRMSIAHLRMCADRQRSPLNDEQQASFDGAYAALGREMATQIRSSLNVAVPKMNVDWPRLDIDMSALVPQMNIDFPTSKIYESLDESTRASFERLSRNLALHLSTAQSIGPRTPPSEPSERSEPAGGADGAEDGVDEKERAEPAESPRPETAEVPPPGPIASELTPQQLIEEVNNDLNLLTLLSNIQSLLAKQAEVVRSQRDSVARGAVFYVVVGLGSALSGIAGLLSLDHPDEQRMAIGLTMAVALFAAGGYFLVRWWQAGGFKQL